MNGYFSLQRVWLDRSEPVAVLLSVIKVKEEKNGLVDAGILDITNMEDQYVVGCGILVQRTVILGAN